MSSPTTPVVWLIMMPGQASRIAATMAVATLGSHEGQCPRFGSCRRKWTWTTLAPSSNARFASRAISSGVTGAGYSAGLVRTPVSAQVTTAFSMSVSVRFDGEQQRAQRRLLASDRARMGDHAVDRRENGILHFHRFDRRERLSPPDPIAGFRLDLDDDAADRRVNRSVRMLVLEPRRMVRPIDDAPDGAFEIEPQVVSVAHVFGAEDDAVARNANLGIVARREPQNQRLAVDREAQGRSAPTRARRRRAAPLDQQ